MDETTDVYQPPALTDLGDFAEVTLGAGWTGTDTTDERGF